MSTIATCSVRAPFFKHALYLSPANVLLSIEHVDKGMMGIVHVQPAPPSFTPVPTATLIKAPERKQGESFYVSSVKQVRGDSNTGTSLLFPWETLRQVQSHLNLLLLRTVYASIQSSSFPLFCR